MTVTTAALTMSIRHQSISGNGSWSRDGLDGAATVQRDGFTGCSPAFLAFVPVFLRRKRSSALTPVLLFLLLRFCFVPALFGDFVLIRNVYPF